MPTARIREFLDDHGIRYEVIHHARAFTAQRTAQTAHSPGGEVAKTVVVKLDGRLALAVVPASENIRLRRLAKVAGANHVELASEAEFAAAFPDCEVGAMPPLGGLYGMEVWVDVFLTRDKEIAFNAGSHTEMIRMPYREFESLVRPRVAEFGAPVGMNQYDA